MDELFEASILRDCEQAFEYLEQRTSRLAAVSVACIVELVLHLKLCLILTCTHQPPIATNAGKGPILLKFCNDLLRRLSRTRDATFCGRILVLLASVFPPEDRSGINLSGAFNLENTTEYDMEPEAEHGDGTSIIKGLPTPPKDFYKVFWGIQDYFSNPLRVFSPEQMVSFRKVTLCFNLNGI